MSPIRRLWLRGKREPPDKSCGLQFQSRRLNRVGKHSIRHQSKLTRATQKLGDLRASPSCHADLSHVGAVRRDGTKRQATYRDRRCSYAELEDGRNRHSHRMKSSSLVQPKFGFRNDSCWRSHRTQASRHSPQRTHQSRVLNRATK
ncbi:unannotated protein [freshwater metagenome]|uniref:Unannotated protein n=1 Tax=freshwater metagenome TaxID=449393 RepID=A0A6J6ZD68_9ZZZZ